MVGGRGFGRRHLQEPVFIYCERFGTGLISVPGIYSAIDMVVAVDAADIVTSCISGCRHSLYGRYGCQRGHVWNVVRDTTGRDVPIWYILAQGEGE